MFHFRNEKINVTLKLQEFLWTITKRNSIKRKSFIDNLSTDSVILRYKNSKIISTTKYVCIIFSIMFKRDIQNVKLSKT